MFSTKLQGLTIFYHNTEEFHSLKQEVFTNHTYYFETKNPAPLIIDVGAHIGLATLYFKKLYPAAQVIALEPQPTNYQALEKNIWENQLNQVTTLPLVVATQTGPVTLHSDATQTNWLSTASLLPGAWNGQQTTQTSIVSGVTLLDLLTQQGLNQVDLLKLDIEGVEQAVLTTNPKILTQIKHIFLEFHPHATQSLPYVLELLRQHYAHVHIWQHGQEIQPDKCKGLVLLEAY